VTSQTTTCQNSLYYAIPFAAYALRISALRVILRRFYHPGDRTV
jgi:hypothetical protein